MHSAFHIASHPKILHACPWQDEQAQPLVPLWQEPPFSKGADSFSGAGGAASSQPQTLASNTVTSHPLLLAYKCPNEFIVPKLALRIFA